MKIIHRRAAAKASPPRPVCTPTHAYRDYSGGYFGPVPVVSDKDLSYNALRAAEIAWSRP